MKKSCNRCGEEKDLEDFYEGSGTFGRMQPCKACKCLAGRLRWTDPDVKAHRKVYMASPAGRAMARKCDLKKKFGITPDDYERMLEAQGGHCALCPATVGNSLRPRLHVDHDHETGAVRKLLCSRCNMALGIVGESVELLKAMIQYLLPEGVLDIATEDLL